MISLRHVILLALCLFSGMLYSQGADLFKLSSSPGAYRENLLLTAEAEPGYSLRYRFPSTEDKERFFPFNQALLLEALPGESRAYRLTIQILKAEKEIGRHDLTYVIDRCPPVSPEILTAPFTHYGSTQVELGLNERDSDASIRSSYRGSDGSNADLRDGHVISLPGQSGQLVTYTLSAFAEDRVHNVSPVKNWTYIIDRRAERDLSEIPLYSPVEGQFQNPQYLYIDNQSFEDIRYSLDGSDPRSGRKYTGGTVLDATGKVELRIWGKTLTGRELEKRLVYEAGTERLPEIESVVISKALTIQFNGDSFHYAAGERRPTVYDETLSKPLRIAPQVGALRGLPLRLLRDRDQAIFRYYLVLDGRTLPAPEVWVRTPNALGGGLITLPSGGGVNGFIELSAQSGPGSKCWYRLDGITPALGGIQSKPFDKALHLETTELRKYADAQGICTLVFQSQTVEGLWGNPLRFTLNVGQVPALPIISIVQDTDKAFRIVAPTWDGKIWYTVNSEYNEKEDAGPFELNDIAKLSLPFGAQGHFSHRFFGITKWGIATPFQVALKSVLSSLPPEEPLITRGIDGKLRVKGSGTIFIRVTADKVTASSVTKGFVPYSEAVALKPLNGENVVYWFEAQTRDNSGNQSAIARSGPYPVHTRAPLEPRVVGGDGELFRNTNNFNLVLESPELGMRYYYTIGTEGSIEDPNENSPFTDSEISIVRKEEKARLELRIVGISTLDSHLVGPVAHFIINLDTRQPSPPKVSGVESGHAYRTPRQIEISADPNSQVSYCLRRVEDSGDRVFIDYQQPIQVEAAANSLINWELSVKSRNRAGSESSLPAPIIFRMDTRIPVLLPPTFWGPDAKQLSADDQRHVVSMNDLKIKLNPANDSIIHYELSQDQMNIRNPDVQSPAYSGPIELNAAIGSSKSWLLRYRAYDVIGNESALSGIYRISISKVRPAIPPEPGLIRQGNSGDLFWQNDPSYTIQYYISLVESPDGQLAFIPYSGDRVHWTIPEAQDRIWLYYRAIDQAGNISETGTMVLSRRQLAALPKITGVSPGGLYQSAVIVRPNSLIRGEHIRYELATGNQQPDIPSSQSPELVDALEIGPISGETVNYHLILRQFVEGYEASDPLSIDFTIDKTPPPPPHAKEAKAVSWLSKSGNFHIEGETGDSIWYTMLTTKIEYGEAQTPLNDGQIQSQIAGQNYLPLDGDIALKSDPAAVLRYVISAYSIDAAGNRSLSLVNWQVFIDTQSVYVIDSASISNAEDQPIETGSRSEPFRDFGQAMNFAAKTNRTNLIVSSGKFALSSRLSPPIDIVIHGGFDPLTWIPNPSGQTLLYPRPGYRDPTLIDLKGTKLSLHNMYLIDAGFALDSLVKQAKGQLSIEDSTLATSLTRQAIDAAQGLLFLSNSLLSSNDALESHLVHLTSMECHIDGSTLESSDLPPVLLKNASRSLQVLIDASNSTIQIGLSHFIPRRGRSTTAIRMQAGSLTVNASEIWTGAGSENASGIAASQGAIIELTGTNLQSDDHARTAVLIRLDSSDLSLKGGVMQLKAESGVYGILATGGHIDLEDGEISCFSVNDFVSVMSVDQTQMNIQGIRISGTDSPDFRIAVIRGGKSNWKENTIRIDAAQSLQGSGMFTFSGIGQHLFEDNTFTGNNRCTLFYLGSPDAKLTIRNNILERWRFLLQEPSSILARQSDMERGVTTIQELERLDRQGSLFEGNKVRQGL